MLRSFIGDKKFQKGLEVCILTLSNVYLFTLTNSSLNLTALFFIHFQLYLNSHKYANAAADDLWEALSKVMCL